MRLEYGFELSQVEVPRFAVEAVEGMGKLFTLATLVLNILEPRPKVEIVFHGLNRDDPARKIQAFQHVMGSCETAGTITYDLGNGGHVPGSSCYFQWLVVSRKT